MTSVEKSREWAEVLLLWLDQASSRFRYYDDLNDKLQRMSALQAWVNHGAIKSQIKRIRDKELKLYLNSR
ncbi:hypothetical protein SAMN04487996_1047 [Dyadobacter soli]|uniref:Uncharacterized protein n=1 Tax=Dyadobacter soli TaxID=659014 RepID=A0A1G7B046_9BACT|nr:hypothetical protein [Dyadobacter soli]SDE19626.1 hypothetical protein SAMN04487996_1047 [Dyadobacter soli]